MEQHLRDPSGLDSRAIFVGIKDLLIVIENSVKYNSSYKHQLSYIQHEKISDVR